MKFSEIFDRCLTERNLSNYKMARDTGISDSLIGYWRKGTRKPTLDNLEMISRYLEVPVGQLIGAEPAFDSLNLKEDERELLGNYRRLDLRGRHRVQTFLYEELDRVEAGGKENEG